MRDLLEVLSGIAVVVLIYALVSAVGEKGCRLRVNDQACVLRLDLDGPSVSWVCEEAE